MMDLFVPIPLNMLALWGRLLEKQKETYRLLASQSFATFGAAAIDYPSTGFGRHPFSKSMSARPFNSTRLKGSFHFFFLLSCEFPYINACMRKNFR